jgi:hypothetical protein
MDVAGRTGSGRRRTTGQRGVAILEFALILPVLVILVLLTVDFGRLVQSRLIISNVSREGGSLASRQTTVDTTLATLLTVSARPLDLAGADGKIIITRITAGQSTARPTPTLRVPISSGSLAAASQVDSTRRYYGLTQRMYNHLVYNSTHSMADISELTVVEIYYKYRPITPLPRFISGMLTPDAGGMILWSKAVF